jgi:2-keto-4-pentenoate hydratase/2-oxohepta-3-ene-1,7-dioic acid hydratase in catechol pathway
LILDFCEALSTCENTLAAPANLISWFDLDGPWLSALRPLQDRLWQDFERPGGTSKALVHRDQVHLLAPVLRPGKLICVGLNYRDHAAESNMPIPDRPVIFSKFTTAVVGSDQPVLLPTTSNKVDYEAELAVVIGRRAKHVQLEQAMDYVLGYTCFNDVSARDLQFVDGQWQRGKSCDTFAPMGPYIATLDEIHSPHKLAIKLRLNGQTMQHSNTDQLIFSVPELIAFLSETITLEPGDVIATGTPPGVGFARNPPVFLKQGDRMEVEIEGLDVLVNSVSAS